MDNLSDVIKQQSYILECIKTLQEIVESGCCNNCNKMDKCEYAPELGKLQRYNCPFYESLFDSLGKDKNV